MAKTTVDYGIDLGTTNSGVARMTPKGSKPIQVGHMNYIPSAVAKSASGDIKVGADALRPDFVPVARQFKRLMGTGETYPLKDGSAWTSVTLSAEVLKALKAAVKRRNNEDLQNVVITVPAMFNQPQCEATNEAAQLAGLNAVTLLQEPIAAATAYLSNDPVEGNYLVYDLGGGTFDVSLVRLRDGEMQVLEHGGDNFLGGSSFDRVVADWVIEQVRQAGGDVAQFGSDRSRFLLFRECERARIELSDVESTWLDLGEFDAPLSRIEINKTMLVDLVEDLVTKTIDLTKDRLITRGFDGSDIRSILLVGGPTQMPYIRERLEQEFQIPLNLDQDPMTVVAEGAAMHASSLLVDVSGPAGGTKAGNSLQLDLHYDPVSPEAETTVAGKILSPGGFKGEICIRSNSGDFDTGWRNLVNGAFSADVTLGRDAITEFTIEARDLTGTKVLCEPGTFSIRSGVRSAQPVAPYNYGVVKADGKVGVVVKAGQALPAFGRERFRFAETLVAGSPGTCNVYFVEGNSPDSNEALKVSELIIRGTDISRTIKEGEEAEIKIRIDESRRLKFEVYVPLLDQDWEGESKNQIDRPDIEDLQLVLANTRVAVDNIEDLVPEDDQDQMLRTGREIERLEMLVHSAAEGNVQDGYQAHKQLTDTQAALRPLRDKYETVALHKEILARIEHSSKFCDENGDSMGKAKLQDLRRDLDKALNLKKRTELEAIKERVMEIFWEHYGKTRECAEYQVDWMQRAAPSASDPVSYYEIVRRAEEALAKDDRRGVLMYAAKAWDFLPDIERMENRFLRPGVR